MLKSAPDAEVPKYFRLAFKVASADNELAVEFAAGCLRKSGRSWEAWSTHGPSSPSSSLLVVKELALDVAPPPGLPLERLAAVITKIAQKIPDKEKELAMVMQ